MPPSPRRSCCRASCEPGQRFGPGHVIDVLLGKDSDKVEKHGHDTLSTFGIGGELTDAQWRSVIRQLLVRGYLRADVDRYGALVLTQASRPLLRGDVTLHLREDPTAPARSRKRRGAQPVAEEDMGLWSALRACRKELADAQGVPPYVIFHDATLAEMIAGRGRATPPNCSASAASAEPNSRNTATRSCSVIRAADDDAEAAAWAIEADEPSTP